MQIISPNSLSPLFWSVNTSAYDLSLYFLTRHSSLSIFWAVERNMIIWNWPLHHTSARNLLSYLILYRQTRPLTLRWLLKWLYQELLSSCFHSQPHCISHPNLCPLGKTCRPLSDTPIVLAHLPTTTEQMYLVLYQGDSNLQLLCR